MTLREIPCHDFDLYKQVFRTKEKNHTFIENAFMVHHSGQYLPKNYSSVLKGNIGINIII
jgi:hypothetical protein